MLRLRDLTIDTIVQPIVIRSIPVETHPHFFQYLFRGIVARHDCRVDGHYFRSLEGRSDRCGGEFGRQPLSTLLRFHYEKEIGCRIPLTKITHTAVGGDR